MSEDRRNKMLTSLQYDFDLSEAESSKLVDKFYITPLNACAICHTHAPRVYNTWNALLCPDCQALLLSNMLESLPYKVLISIAAFCRARAAEIKYDESKEQGCSKEKSDA